MAAPRPTEIGDVLVLKTSLSFTIYAVGSVATKGQEDFSRSQGVRHVGSYDEAVQAAKAVVAPQGRIHLIDIDTGNWSEISN